MSVPLNSGLDGLNKAKSVEQEGESAQLYEGEGEERDQRESWRSYKQKPNGKTDLGEQMVSAFLPKALHTHRNHFKESGGDELKQ